MTATRCQSYIVARASKLDRPFLYSDLLEDPECAYKYGTLRNVTMRLLRDGRILKFPVESPARFILKEWSTRPEYARWFTHDNTPTGGHLRSVGAFDFVRFVELLDWDELEHVHDVRVEFDVSSFSGVCSDDGWRWSERSHSWGRRFEDLEFPLFIQLFNTGRVQVIVKCSMEPLAFSFEGLTRLMSVLGEVKGLLGWTDVPNVAEWLVTSWHYGRDSVKEVSGVSFNVTFITWAGAFARIYVKSRLKKVRVEEIQSPRRTVQQLLEDIINRDREGEKA